MTAAVEGASAKLPFVLTSSTGTYAQGGATPPASATGLLDVRDLIAEARREIRELARAQATLTDLVTQQRNVPRLDPVVDAPTAPQEGTSGPLEFRLLRFFEVRTGDRVLDRWTSKKARLLLAFLAMRGDAPVSRDALIETFWPDSSPARGANNLSIAVHQIRSRLGEVVDTDDRGIRLEQGAYRLSPELGARVDVIEFERLIDHARRSIDAGRSEEAREDLRASLELYTGDLLESDPYEDWTVEPRRALSEKETWALKWLADDAVSSESWEDALQLGRRMVWRDACSEPGHQLIILALSKLGDRAAALRQYEQCCESLRSELGVEPSPETRALAALVGGTPSLQVALDS